MKKKKYLRLLAEMSQIKSELQAVRDYLAATNYNNRHN